MSFSHSPLMKATLLEAIGETFSGLGLPQESLDAFERVTKLRREALGDDHPATLASMSHLAAALQDAGRIDQALELFESVLSRRKAKLGPEHPDTLEATNDLAVAYWESGQAARAIPLYEQVLNHEKARLSPDDPDTLTVMDNLAVAYAATGEPLKAIPLHEAVLARSQATLGQASHATLITMNNLARAYEKSGQLDRAIQLYKATLEKTRPKLSDDHPQILILLQGLGEAYQAAGRLDLAIGLFDDVLAKRQAKLGPDHPDTLRTTYTLAMAYFQTRNEAKAVPLAMEFVTRWCESSTVCRGHSGRTFVLPLPFWPITLAGWAVPRKPAATGGWRKASPTDPSGAERLTGGLEPPLAGFAETSVAYDSVAATATLGLMFAPSRICSGSTRRGSISGQVLIRDRGSFRFASSWSGNSVLVVSQALSIA